MIRCSDESSPPWYALYVKHRHEKKVALSLAGKAVHTFVPTCPRTHRNGSRFEVPLFPGYVFGRIDISAPLPVISTPGVFGIVPGGSTPGPIPEEEIEYVRRLIATGLPVAPTDYFCPGQEIALNEGPLKGIRGFVLDASNERWLIVSIHMLQRSVAVKLDRRSVVAWS
jgi:transcription termination/antitermination protein NusG